ncbi:hypothetical protein LSH36_330g02023 [Paralvinella palmiformis]|uniref:Uncharacterized protein n=1 Tax=Paralvinella palmiformis TaxID=53620 RepID=A0AAD9N2Z5_9ANNE|nr:hypothetical protein LSH36_330g02023 [Paralvinella palmiformis]
MGCGQSIRKKSKHKTEIASTKKSYENKSFGAASLVESGCTANTNDLNEVAAKCSVSPSGGHSKSDDLPEQANGDTRLGHSLDGMRQKNSTRKDSGVVQSCLQTRSHMSQSQLEFFRLLDEKIAQGKDYDPSEVVS